MNKRLKEEETIGSKKTKKLRIDETKTKKQKGPAPVDSIVQRNMYFALAFNLCKKIWFNAPNVGHGEVEYPVFICSIYSLFVVLWGL